MILKPKKKQPTNSYKPRDASQLLRKTVGHWSSGWWSWRMKRRRLGKKPAKKTSKVCYNVTSS